MYVFIHMRVCMYVCKHMHMCHHKLLDISSSLWCNKSRTIFFCIMNLLFLNTP